MWLGGGNNEVEKKGPMSREAHTGSVEGMLS